jgi:hypothetical protein
MIRFFAKWRAKRADRWKLELEAANRDVNAQLAENRAKEKRAFVDQLNREADDIETNIAKEEAKLEKGYYLCENGHESEKPFLNGTDSFSCPDCSKPAKLIMLSQMTGQEKYEADREKDDAKKIAAQKRQQAEQEATNATDGMKTAKRFRDLANNSRIVADKIKRL